MLRLMLGGTVEVLPTAHLLGHPNMPQYAHSCLPFNNHSLDKPSCQAWALVFQCCIITLPSQHHQYLVTSTCYKGGKRKFRFLRWLNHSTSILSHIFEFLQRHLQRFCCERQSGATGHGTIQSYQTRIGVRFQVPQFQCPATYIMYNLYNKNEIKILFCIPKID